MRDLRTFLRHCSDEEFISEAGIEMSDDPGIISASLAALTEYYPEPITDGDFRKIAAIALDRIFSSISKNSEEDPEEMRKFLYRIAAETLSEHLPEYYEGHSNEYPSNFINFKPKPAWIWEFTKEFKEIQNKGGNFNPDFNRLTALKMFGYTVGQTSGWEQPKR